MLSALLLFLSEIGAAAQSAAPAPSAGARPTVAPAAIPEAGGAAAVEAQEPVKGTGAGKPKVASLATPPVATGEAGQPGGDEQENSPAAPAKASSSPAETPKPSAPGAPPALRDALKAAPRGAGRAQYRAIIEKETARTSLPAQIAEAVLEVESGGNPAVIGAAGEIGLMQVMPPTARMLGFSGSLADLAQPEVNIHYGVTYLSQAWRLAGGDLCTAVMKYRAGHGETRFSQLSVNYCVAVRSRLAARGYPVSGAVPIATFGELSRPFTTRLSVGGAPFAGPPRVSLRAPPACRSHCLAELGGGRPNFDALNSTLNHLVLQSNVRAIRLH